MRNITVDDRNSSGLISYYPPLCNDVGWAVVDGRGHDGSFRWCSNALTPTATFNFTGVAVYYMCPPINGGSMQFVLDGVSSGDVNLTSSVARLSNSPTPSVVWWKTGLENKRHTVQLLPGSGSSRVNVDAFIYTVLEEGDPTPSSAAPTPSSSTGARASSPSTASSSSPSNKVALGLGITFGALAFLIFLAIAYLLRRTTKRQAAQFSWKVPVPPLARSGEQPSNTFDAELTTGSESLNKPKSSLTPSYYHSQSPPPHAKGTMKRAPSLVARVPLSAEDAAFSAARGLPTGARSLPPPPLPSGTRRGAVAASDDDDDDDDDGDDDFDPATMMAAPAPLPVYPSRVAPPPSSYSGPRALGARYPPSSRRRPSGPSQRQASGSSSTPSSAASHSNSYVSTIKLEPNRKQHRP